MHINEAAGLKRTFMRAAARAFCAVVFCVTQIETVSAEQLPDERSFAMVLNTFPRDFSPDAIVQTYDFVREHADMVAHHIDKGVPWPEALAGEAYHDRLIQELQFRKHYLRDMPVFLAVSAISVERDGLNGYWAEEDRGARPGEWRGRGFADPQVVDAFISYCDFLIGLFEPQIMLYGIEANMLAEKSPDQFNDYVAMSGKVYAALKARHPELLLGISIHRETLIDGGAAQNAAAIQLLAYSDMVAASTYPYMSVSAGQFAARHTDPNRIPVDWLSSLQELAPEKPLVVAETGFPAETFEVAGTRFAASAEAQETYLHRLLGSAADLNARAVMWFLPMDYDPFYERLPPGSVREIFKLFRDTGLADGAAEPRPALDLWDSWRALPARM